MARPKKEISIELIEKLAKVGCSNESIAIQCGCSVDTLTRRFADVLSKSREGMKTSLRIWQLELARKGNATMLIWLGKQLLGQKENNMMDDEGISEIEIKVTKHGKDNP